MLFILHEIMCWKQHKKDNFFREFLVVRIFFTPTLPTLSHSKESCVYWLSERTSISVHSIHKSNCFRRKKIYIFFCLCLSQKCKTWKWYFVTKIVVTYCEKKLFLVIEENIWNFEAEGREFANFEITRTIYSNSERSEQFLVAESFFNLFLEVSHI